MRELTVDNVGLVVRVPDDPAEGKSAVLCIYKTPKGEGGTIVAGNGHDVVPLTMMLLDNVMKCFDNKRKAAFIGILGEHLVEMTKDVDGVDAIMIKKRKHEEDEEDEDDLDEDD